MGMDREREVIKENKQVESRRKCFFYWLPEANDQCHLASLLPYEYIIKEIDV